ncbi:camp-dependent protein kinase regulatory subunit [Spathaspora passalidarum NRRL Y-27907]|uniref:cAMP-dependent protein kinase regulatory subunit n=1 Tax=Spathaspora passalidarum (strain NRRL Y-27907 / 11-Y1) TaxID=619300 RepID=G3AK93_SPAPN|nr:camp-dependent protein kinase regulatory subunit [Spathaspora passalidarum NRRL Y-27907]EGW33552.1 camp-dependent protein kinase regulatory subunit [Spathaspora passalidarum NRRL Y-27907]
MSHQQQQQFITEELSQLQREILTKNPTDILQFCANYFNSKLQAQRTHLWEQQAKANAAGIDLFPPVTNISLNASGIGFLQDRQPSFKSPFGLNDPHSNHDDDPHAPASNFNPQQSTQAPQSANSEPAGSLFKSNFDGTASSSSKIQKEVDPSSPNGESSSHPSALPFKPAGKIPIAFNANRRTSVSAEALNPAKLKSESWKPPVNNLSAEEEATLAQNLKNNFLFKQLDAQSKRTVLAALSSRHFPKDTVIIKQGDEGDYFYIIEKGTVDFYVNDAKVNSSGEGSSFGELALMYNAPRAATAIAATDVTCWALDRLTFRRILLEGTFNRRLMYEDFLKGVKVLESLSDHERSKLADALWTEMYHAGDKIVTEGDQGENFYLIESGNCDVYSQSGGHLARLTKGDYFGEVALLNDLPRQATVQALDNVIVATLGKSGFQRLLGPAVDVLKAQDPTKSHDAATTVN